MANKKTIGLAACVVGLVASLSAASQPTFLSPQTYSVGEGPSSMAAGDYNSDGLLDMAVVNTDGLSFSILYRQPGGTYGQREDHVLAQPGSGLHPSGAASGDFNGDGVADIAVGRPYSNVVTVFFGQKAGPLTNQRDYATQGQDPWNLVAADLNKDGRLDLAMANYYSNTVGVLYGQAGGLFGTYTSFAVGQGPNAVAAGDFNRDDRTDIVVVSSNVSKASILYGQAGGGLGGRSDYAVNYYPLDVVAADFNRDGYLDAAVSTNGGPGNISVLYGSASGGFGSRTDYPSPYHPEGIAAADFNGDGLLDLAITYSNSDQICILFGLAGGGFGNRQDIPMGANTHPTELITADFDANGWPDLAVTNYYSDSVTVLYNAMPEPTTLSLLALGGLALLRRRGRAGVARGSKHGRFLFVASRASGRIWQE